MSDKTSEIVTDIVVDDDLSVAQTGAVDADAVDGEMDEVVTLTVASDAESGSDSEADVESDEESDADGSHDDNLQAGDSGRSRGRRSPSRAALEREGEIAADFIETLLDICDLDGDLDVDVDGDRAVVSLVDSDEGRVPRRLVGSDGQVLDALQELTRLAVYAQTGDRSRLMLDIAGHRAKRREALVAQAMEAIELVKGGADRSALSPMSAFERKVVHDEVLAAGLVSESEGSEPRRYVVVFPAGA